MSQAISSFLAGRHLAPQQAFFWPRLPKISLFGTKKCVFGSQIQFLETSSENFHHHYAGTPIWQIFCVDRVARQALGQLPGPMWALFWPENLHFFYVAPMSPNMKFVGQNLPCPSQEPPVQSFQHKKGPIHLILTTFWGEITFGQITQWLGAYFEEIHFFWDALYMITICDFFLLDKTKLGIN